VLLQFVTVKHSHGKHRDQADQGANAEFVKLAIRVTQDVVEEAVLLVPNLLHRHADVDVMLEELGREPFIGLVLFRQLQRDPHHVQAEEAHPSGAVGLFENRAAGQPLAAIDHGDVVQAEESAFENIVALAINLVHPPCEIDQQFVKTLFENSRSRTPVRSCSIS